MKERIKIKGLKDNAAVVHAWAHAANNEYGDKNSLSFKDSTLDSYNTAIARKLDCGLVLISGNTFSVSTGKHISLARQAISHLESVEVPNLSRGNDLLASQVLDGFEAQIEYLLEQINQAKQQRTKDKFTLLLNDQVLNLKKLLEIKFVLKKDIKEKAVLEVLANKPAGEVAARLEKLKKAMEKAAERARIKKQKENADKLAQEILDFRAFKINQISFRATQGTDLVRYEAENKRIRTSQGVELPVAFALTLRKAMWECKDARISICNSRELERRYGKLGAYLIDSISAQGDARVGCHNFSLAEVERCYNEEYLPTIKKEA